MRYRSWGEADIHCGGTGDQDAGFFEWEVAEDLMRADGAVAKLFGLAEIDTEKGLSILSYVNLIHPCDRKRVARAIHDSLLNCTGFSAACSILRADGSLADVLLSGRCFRNHAGQPAHVSGVIHPAKPKPKHNAVHHWVATHAARRRNFSTIAANNA